MTEPLPTLKVRGRLRMKPGICMAADRTRGVSITVVDVNRLFCVPITVQWMGQQAMAFYEAHKDELVPGRCLDFVLFSFFSEHDCQRASVESCQIAPLPPSWIKHAEKSTASASTVASTAATTTATTPTNSGLRTV